MHVLRFIVANNILRLRTDAEMSRAELGEKIHYSEDYILKWERAETMPDDDAIAALAEALGVTKDYLMNPHDEWVSKEEKEYLENASTLAPAVETKNIRREEEKAEEPAPLAAEAPVTASKRDMVTPLSIITGAMLTIGLVLFMATGGKFGCSSAAPEATAPHVHEYARWELAFSPTEFDDGNMRKYCDCGDYITHVIPASTQGLFVEELGDGTCAVTGVGHNSETPLDAFKTIVIPPYITLTDGEGAPVDLTVVAIGEGFLGSLGDMYLERVQEIILPDTVRSIGGYAFYGTAIDSITLPGELATIGEYAFAHCESLREIELPEGVESIGEGAFKGCTSLNRVKAQGIAITEIPQYAFKDCESLYGAHLGGGVTVINEGAFENCTSLKDIDVGRVERVEKDAFKQCVSIEYIDFPDHFRYIGESAFEGCTGITELGIDGGEIPLTIERNAFKGCTGIRTAGRDNKLPDRIEYIGEYAFAGCASLDWVMINVKEISPNAFSGCTALRGVEFGEDVTYIRECAFEGCASISYIELPSSVQRVNDYAFKDCTGLQRFQTFGRLEYIGGGVFAGCEKLITLDLYDITEGGFADIFRGNTSIETVNVRTGTVTAYAFENCTSLIAITLWQDVTDIGERAFAGCTSLCDVYLTEGLEKIGDYAFAECSGMQAVKLPESVTHIGKYAFWKSGVYDVTIGENVTSLGEYAFSESAVANLKIDSIHVGSSSYTFANCANLEKITIAEGVKTIGIGMFSGCQNYNLTNIVLPESVTHIYKQAFEKCNWLASVTIPNRDIMVGDDAFYYCQHLQQVNFGGTVDEVWGNTGSLGLNLSGTEGRALDITVVCTDGEVVIRK